MAEQPGEKLAAESYPWTYTSATFITAAPLYTEALVKDQFLPPRKISFECPGDCDKETTWEKMHDSAALGSRGEEPGSIPDRALKTVAYSCGLCGKETVTVIYREMLYIEREQRVVSPPSGGPMYMPAPPAPGREDVRHPAARKMKEKVLIGVMKVGQYPAPGIYVPHGLRKNLGTGATALYRKALISRNNGYGLAALGYMRRVVEDKTNELIGIAADYAESIGATPEQVGALRLAGNSEGYTPFEKKLEIAATVFPPELKLGDTSPLQVLYADVSRGLHGLSEEECLETADEIRTVFEYVFENLKAQVESKKTFADKLKKLTKTKPSGNAECRTSQEQEPRA